MSRGDELGASVRSDRRKMPVRGGLGNGHGQFSTPVLMRSILEGCSLSCADRIRTTSSLTTEAER